MNKLYLAHLGFYDPETGHGVYESHINLFVVAESFSEAREKTKQHPMFKLKKMHVDGLQEINTVDGYRITPEPNPAENGQTNVVSLGYSDLKKRKPSDSTSG